MGVIHIAGHARQFCHSLAGQGARSSPQRSSLESWWREFLLHLSQQGGDITDIFTTPPTYSLLLLLFFRLPGVAGVWRVASAQPQTAANVDRTRGTKNLNAIAIYSC